MTSVQIRRVRIRQAVIVRVAAEGGDQLDAAAREQIFDHEGVAADVVLAQQVDLELVFVNRVVRGRSRA